MSRERDAVEVDVQFKVEILIFWVCGGRGGYMNNS
jgi:hypothetical protein